MAAGKNVRPDPRSRGPELSGYLLRVYLTRTYTVYMKELCEDSIIVFIAMANLQRVHL